MIHKYVGSVKSESANSGVQQYSRKLFSGVATSYNMHEKERVPILSDGEKLAKVYVTSDGKSLS